MGVPVKTEYNFSDLCQLLGPLFLSWNKLAEWEMIYKIISTILNVADRH